MTRENRPRIMWGRWRAAQQYEQSFWAGVAGGIENGARSQLDWYAWRARQLEERLARVDGRAGDGRILEIGSGPIGIVNFLGGSARYAIDPLEDFYQQTPSLVELRRPGATYLKGTGEVLPFVNGSFSLVIIDNVIDHTYAPDAILAEIRRILEPDGQLYLSVNVHTRGGAVLHGVLAALRIDKGHPYTFTSRRLRALLARHRFTVRFEAIDDYKEARRADRTSPRLKDRLKGYLGLSEFAHTVICSPEGSRTPSASPAAIAPRIDGVGRARPGDRLGLGPLGRRIAGYGRRRLLHWRERQRMSRIRREPTALAAAVKSAQRILLVCHGNIIRSPFAARLLARELGERTGVSVGAGGLEAVAGKPAHPTAVLMAAARGLDLADHLAAPLTAEAVAAADLILVMEVPHLLALASRFPQARSKTFLLTCLAPDLPLEIDDPVAGDEGRFQTCFEQIAAALRPILGFLGGPESVPPLTTSRGDRP